MKMRWTMILSSFYNAYRVPSSSSDKNITIIAVPRNRTRSLRINPTISTTDKR